MIAKKKVAVIGGVPAVFLAMLLLPIVPISAQSPPQPLPSQACPALGLLSAGSSYGLPYFSTSFPVPNSKGVTMTVIIQNLSGGSNPQQGYMRLGYLQVLALNETRVSKNLTAVTQVLWLETRDDSLFVKRISNASYTLQLSVPEFTLVVSPAFARQLGIPLTSLYFYRLTVFATLDCADGTYTTAYGAQTSAASLLQGYLAFRGLRF